MANLIITIIAIALVAVAALMGAYYGGTAFNQGQDKAKASAIMNQAAQIQAAAQMYRVDYNAWPTAIADLTGSAANGEVYLSNVPQLDGTAWAIGTNEATLGGTAVTAEICTELENEVGSSSSVWSCSAATGVSYDF